MSARNIKLSSALANNSHTEQKQTTSSSSVHAVAESVKTLGLATIGTLAIVGAHHLGRKQYNPNARLRDYTDGVRKVFLNSVFANSIGKFQQDTGTAAHRYPVASSSFQKTHDNEKQRTVTTDKANWVSGVADLKTNDFAVVAIDSDRHIVWQTKMPERVHDILIQPLSIETNNKPHTRHVTVMGRRPSECFWVLDAATGDVLYKHHAEQQRHYYGHACYSLDGLTLYITENDTQTFAGKIGVYDVQAGYKKINEFDTQGIGPHELVMHPDGDTLVIANGGIKTEKASREELNLDSMQPSLVYINRHTGELLEQIIPEHNQMSVRHLSMHDDGTVAIGIQFQGEKYLSVPLVLTHRRGQAKFSPLVLAKEDSKGWHRFHHYIASVVVDSYSNLLCVTSPIGGCAAIFDLVSGKMIDATPLPDCAGAATWHSCSDNLPNSCFDNQSNDRNTDGNSSSVDMATSSQQKPASQFLVSDGQGYLTKITVNPDLSGIKAQKVKQSFAFDNHLKQL